MSLGGIVFGAARCAVACLAILLAFSAALSPARLDAATPTPGGCYSEVTPGGASVTASANDGNVPANTVDNSLATRWSANGDGQWIRYDLGSTRMLGYVKIAFYSGNTRQSRFDLQTSTDGTSWSNALAAAMSGGATTAEQAFDFEDRGARYVRYLCLLYTSDAADE